MSVTRLPSMYTAGQPACLKLLMAPVMPAISFSLCLACPNRWTSSLQPALRYPGGSSPLLSNPGKIARPTRVAALFKCWRITRSAIRKRLGRQEPHLGLQGCRLAPVWSVARNIRCQLQAYAVPLARGSLAERCQATAAGARGPLHSAAPDRPAPRQGRRGRRMDGAARMDPPLQTVGRLRDNVNLPPASGDPCPSAQRVPVPRPGGPGARGPRSRRRARY